MENVDSDFFRALYSVYKNWDNSFFILYLLTFLKRDTPSSYKYFKKYNIYFKKYNKYTNIGLRCFKNIVHMHIIPLIKLYNFRKRKIHITHHHMSSSIDMCNLPHVH